MKEKQIVIIGGGITGCLLAWRLHLNGQSYFLYDDPDSTSASKVAAGLINPLTGRKFNFTWKYHLLLETALTLYGEIEKTSGKNIIHPCKIIKKLDNPLLENNWEAAAGDPFKKKYIEKTIPADLKEATQKSLGIIRGCYRIDLRSVIAYIKNKINTSYREQKLPDEALHKDSQSVIYIYTNGAAASKSKFWDYLPWNLWKGEIFRVRQELKNNSLVYKSKGEFIAENRHLWIGSYNTWEFNDEDPTPEGKEHLNKIIEKNKELIQMLFGETGGKVLHQSAVRPTTNDRRPFLGRHPVYSNFYICNGMGTKGALYAPMCTKWLLRCIFKDEQIPEELEINRFYDQFKKGRL